MHVLDKVKQSSQQSSRKKSWQSGEHHTAVPSARRLAAAAPVANTRGSTPKIKAKEVIITHHGGRKEALDQGLKEKSHVRLLAKTGNGQLLGNLFRFKSTEWFPFPVHRQYY